MNEDRQDWRRVAVQRDSDVVRYIAQTLAERACPPNVKILADATTAEHATGIRVVIEGFLDGLSRSDLRNDVLVATGPSARIPVGLRTRQLPIARTRLGRLLFQRLLLPVFTSAVRSDNFPVQAVFLLDSYAPLFDFGDTRYSAFIHDVLPLTHGRYWSASQRTIKSMAFASLRRAGAQLLTSSEHNAEQIHRLFGVRPEVALFGCGQLRDDEADAFLRKGPEPREDYVLYIGAIEERKNVHTLIEAFELAIHRLPPGTRLLLVGRPKGSYGARVAESLGSLRRRNAVEILSGISRERAIALIARAAALVFPSDAEGFGLPVLEALAVGTPVVTSDIPEIRSWAGSTVMYATPSDTASIASAIEGAVRGASPPPQDGQELSRQYRWRAFADTTATAAMSA
jgi:glycosyltransferase involved in cell wall biosynthesis